MKSIFLAAACAAVLSLAACGGGGDDAPAVAAGPATLLVTDSVAGSGAAAVPGKQVTVAYTGWLYSASAPANKGMQFDSGTISFTLGVGAVIAGWDQGLSGMQAGGKRTLTIPASLAYGSSGSGRIPPNAALLFDVELLKVE